MYSVYIHVNMQNILLLVLLILNAYWCYFHFTKVIFLHKILFKTLFFSHFRPEREQLHLIWNEDSFFSVCLLCNLHLIYLIFTSADLCICACCSDFSHLRTGCVFLCRSFFFFFWCSERRAEPGRAGPDQERLIGFMWSCREVFG